MLHIHAHLPPHGNMLIGWPEHKTRKHRFSVARTVCPVCCDGGRRVS